MTKPTADELHKMTRELSTEIIALIYLKYECPAIGMIALSTAAAGVLASSSTNEENMKIGLSTFITSLTRDTLEMWQRAGTIKSKPADATAH